MALTDNVSYFLLNVALRQIGTNYLYAHGAYTVTWNDPPLEAAYAIGLTATLDLTGHPSTQATLHNTGGNVLQVITK